MNDAPRLGRQDLQEELERLYGAERKRHLVAIYGQGDDEPIDLPSAGKVWVRSVRSELELRQRMLELGAPDEKVAFLVPWSTEIPLDLAGRFALNGRIRKIGKDARLRRLFGVAELDEAVPSSPLAAYLLGPKRPAGQKLTVPAGRLTLDVMWAEWLRADWSVPVEGGLALDTLLGWAALDARGARFAEAMQVDEAAGVRGALFTHLARELGPAGPVVWRAWESGRGRRVLEHAALIETLVSSPSPAVQMWVKQRTRHELELDASEPVEAIAQGLARSAGPALRSVRQRAGDAEVRAITRAADARADEPEIREALATSSRLASSWKLRLERLGQALLDIARAPRPAGVEVADRERQLLESHEFFKDDDQTHTVRRAEMAVRLAAWLVVRPDRRIEDRPTPYAAAIDLARWYAEEGGYVDWARRWARGSSDGVFGAGIAAIVSAADEARTELDRRFARSLREWIVAGRPSSDAIPIEHAVRRLATKFLEENAERRLLVLLIDGMAWAQAVEILESLGERPAPWGPLAWHGSKAGRIGEGLYPVVFANLPTVTEVSRAAFFAGKALPAGTEGNTEKDIERWRANKDVAKLLGEGEAPRLFLRAEGHTKGGAASQEALTAVGPGGPRVVAMVINAIDASLKGDTQEWHRWTAENIRSLPELLEKAREAGRVVLIASDHGHVPRDRLTSGISSEGGGARWRPLRDGSPSVAEHEVAFPVVAGVWAPKGATAVVLTADDEHRYGSSGHAGEHGGATLAEVVTPCVLLGCDEGSLQTDKGLAVGAAYVPGWWHFDARAATAPDSEPGVSEPARTPPAQLPLPSVEPPPRAVTPKPEPKRAAKTDPPEVRDSPLSRSKILEARAPSAELRRRVLRAVYFLLERSGVASEAAFAAGMKEPSYRVGGLISVLQEVLNVDGYDVLRHDRQGRQVHLDREKLAQQFEVDL